MPRLTNRPPKMTRCGDKARVSLNGRKHYLGKWDSPEAKAKYHRLITQWRKQHDVEVASLDRYLVAELTADYLDYSRDYYGPGHNRYTSIAPTIRRFGLQFGDMWTDEFRPRHLEQARDMWIKRKCAREYINRVTREIVRCFEWGVSQDKVPSHVWQALLAVRGLHKGRHGVKDAAPIQAVPTEVVDKTLPHLPRKIADMVRLQLLSGCRPNEIMRITPGEVDRSEDVWRYRPSQHKNAWREKSRIVYFGPQAQQILASYLLRDAQSPCFQNNRGEQFARAGYRQSIRRACEKHGLPHWTPNQLRHLKATELRKMRNLEVARVVLGHTSATVTQIYAELNEEPAIQAAKEFG